MIGMERAASLLAFNETVESLARRSGRTNKMVELAKDGDTIVVGSDAMRHNVMLRLREKGRFEKVRVLLLPATVHGIVDKLHQDMRNTTSGTGIYHFDNEWQHRFVARCLDDGFSAIREVNQHLEAAKKKAEWWSGETQRKANAPC